MRFDINRKQILGIILVALLIGNLVTTFIVIQKLDQTKNRVNAIDEHQEVIGDMIVGGVKGNSTSGGEFATHPTNRTASTIFIGYDSKVDEAKIVRIEATRIPEDGLYTNVDSVNVRSSVQRSWRRAQRLVSQTKYGPSGEGILVEFQAPGVWEYISGQSSALAAAVAIAATDPRVALQDDVALTGGLDQYGRITPVTGIKAKAIAARESGKNVLIVPQGYDEEVAGIEIKEARTLGEAMELALEPSGETARNLRGYGDTRHSISNRLQRV